MEIVNIVYVIFLVFLVFSIILMTQHVILKFKKTDASAEEKAMQKKNDVFWKKELTTERNLIRSLKSAKLKI